MSKKKNWIIISATILVATGLLTGTLILAQRGPEKPPPFLPGVYACETQNDFCHIDDTLTIRRIRLGANNYLVTRTTAFTRIRKGRKDPPEIEGQRWTVV